jgi:hypothetical protein
MIKGRAPGEALAEGLSKGSGAFPVPAGAAASVTGGSSPPDRTRAPRAQRVAMKRPASWASRLLRKRKVSKFEVDGVSGEEGQGVGGAGGERQVAQGVQQVAPAGPFPGGLRLQDRLQVQQLAGFLEAAPDAVPVHEFEPEILAQPALGGIGVPGPVQDRVFQGVDQDLLLERLQVAVPLGEAEHAPVDRLLPEPAALRIVEQFTQRREVEGALAHQVAAELLAGHFALEMDQLPLAEVEPAHAIVLVQDEFAIPVLLPDRAQKDRQVPVRNGVAHGVLQGCDEGYMMLG